MVTRSNFISRAFKRRGHSISKRIMSFKWGYPALLLLLSFALLRRTLTTSSSLQRSQSSLPKLSTCENFSDALKLEHDMLIMNISENYNAAQDQHVPLPDDWRYMWYAPHDGFDKQVSQLVNALKIAMLLNRTLIVPPIFEQGEVFVGDCLESQVSPRKLQELAWSAVAERIADTRYSYVSIADIIDLRTVSPKWVETVDMRVFLALWCGIDISSACSAEGEICRNFTNSIHPWKSLESCGARFLPPKRSCIVREVEESCKTTVWTNSENRATRDMWEQLLEKTILEQLGLVQHSSGTDSHYGNYHYIKRKSVVESLGPGTAAANYSLLAFGSLLSEPFGKLSLVADIRPTPGHDVMEQAFAAIEALPYTEEIMRGTRHILELSQLSSRPFFCANLDLGNVRHEGEEKGEVEADSILTAFRSRLENLVEERSRDGERVNVFVMTDLLSEIWNEKYLRDVADNSTFYEIYTVDGYEDTLLDTAHQTMMLEYGLKSGFIPAYRSVAAAASSVTLDIQHSHVHWDSGSRKVELPPDIRGCVEEVVCSCATLGFYGTFPSAVSSRIVNLRRAQLCPTLTTTPKVAAAA